MLELVIFDVDGLMIDTESVWKNAFDKAGDKYGIPNLGDTLFPSLIGKRLEDEQELLDRLLPSDIQDKLLNEWRQIGLLYARMSERKMQSISWRQFWLIRRILQSARH